MRRNVLFASVLLVALGTGVLLFFFWPREADDPALRSAAAQTAPTTASRRIKATLFYVSTDGARLVPSEREVPFAEGTPQQAKRIIEAVLAPPPADAVSAIPAGTTLRALYVTDRGEAYVDLSHEVSSAHPGGTVNEILTVYTIVQALTVNLPAVSAVQILIDGREVDTLAGHVDIRRPLPRSSVWLAQTGK